MTVGNNQPEGLREKQKGKTLVSGTGLDVIVLLMKIKRQPAYLKPTTQGLPSKSDQLKESSTESPMPIGGLSLSFLLSLLFSYFYLAYFVYGTTRLAEARLELAKVRQLLVFSFFQRFCPFVSGLIARARLAQYYSATSKYTYVVRIGRASIFAGIIPLCICEHYYNTRCVILRYSTIVSISTLA